MISNNNKIDMFDSILEDIKNYVNPEDIYDKETLEEWAKENGFVEAGEE